MGISLRYKNFIKIIFSIFLYSGGLNAKQVFLNLRIFYTALFSKQELPQRVTRYLKYLIPYIPINEMIRRLRRVNKLHAKIFPLILNAVITLYLPKFY